MEQTIALASLFALSAMVAAAIHAQPGGTKSIESGKKTHGTLHRGVGVVKELNPAKGTVIVAHDAIKSLGWPAMTMGFTIRDKALFNNFAVGRKVEFEFVEEGKDYVITAVR
jgi:Cu(I)/Ag(I) efflux system protein CusF